MKSKVAILPSSNIAVTVHTLYCRVKEHKTVYCLLKKVLLQMLSKAEELDIHITRIISKVFFLSAM